MAGILINSPILAGYRDQPHQLVECLVGRVDKCLFAHATLGQLVVNLTRTTVDVTFTTLHKWRAGQLGTVATLEHG